MTQPNLLNLAKQGDTRALTSLLNRSLQARGIVAKATKRNDTLHILLEAASPPSQAASVRCIQQGLEKLELVDAPVTIYGRQSGETAIAWQEHLTAPINEDVQSNFFDSELLDDSDSPIPTGGEPTEVSEDWSDQATAIETADPLVPPPPPGQLPTPASVPPAPAAAAQQSAEGENWDSFEIDGEGAASPSVLDEPPLTEAATFEAPDESWGAGMPVDYSPDDPEPTLIVPDEAEEDMDGPLSDEDADSEILLSLWDDANLADDDLDPSGDVSVDNLQLWQDGQAETETASASLEGQPMLVGEPESAARQGDRRGSAAVPLVFLLGLLAMIGGVATAARLGAFNPPWLASIPGVGPLLLPAERTVDTAQGDTSSTSDGTAQAGDVVDSADPQVEESAADSAAAEANAGSVEGEQLEEGEPEGGASETTPENPVEAVGAAAPAAAEGENQVDAGSVDSGDETRQSTDDPSETDPSETGEQTVEAFEPFREAVNAAQTAANLTQTASSPEDWSEVADYWSIAVENMQVVPTDHPRYDVAQQKISEYQRNLDYAQQFF